MHVFDIARVGARTDADHHRGIAAQVARIVRYWRKRSGRIRVSRLSTEWLRKQEIDALKHDDDR